MAINFFGSLAMSVSPFLKLLYNTNTFFYNCQYIKRKLL
nr:MAG TPA: hypothetical protein [Bacteriophage sp.]